MLGKRTMDFKVSYLDAGLPNSYFTESEQLMSTTPPVTPHLTTAPARVNRRYKTQLRDFLSTCRTKRKLAGAAATPTQASTTTVGVGVVSTTPIMNTSMPTPVDYIATADGCSAAYNMYPSPYAPAPATDHSLTSYIGHSNYQHGLYSTTTALDNRYLTTTENLFHQYRPLGGYYPEYHTATATPYVGNGFLEMSGRGASCTMPTYDPTPSNYQLSTRSAVMPVDDKLYSCQQVVDPSATVNKYPTYVDSSRGYVTVGNKCLDVSWPYSVSPSSGIIQPVQVMSGPPQIDMSHVNANVNINIHTNHKSLKIHKHPSSIDGMSSNHSEVSSPVNSGILTPKMEDMQNGSPLTMGNQNHFSPVVTVTTPSTSASVQEVTRQTVLMWGSQSSSNAASSQMMSASNSSTSRSPPSNPSTPTVSGHYTTTVTGPCDPLKSLAEMNNSPGEMCKWTGSVVEAVKAESATPAVAGSQPGSPGLGAQHPHPHSHQNSRVVMVL